MLLNLLFLGLFFLYPSFDLVTKNLRSFLMLLQERYNGNR